MEHHESPVAVGQSAEGSPEATVDEVATVRIDEELLVEEISIDGMCGVY
ncbi:MAG: mycofactocin precursor MftA [Ilumatobacteraceae bacterium]